MIDHNTNVDRPAPDPDDSAVLHCGPDRGKRLASVSNDVLAAYVARLWRDESDPRYPNFHKRTRRWLAAAQDQQVRRIISARAAKRA